MAGPDLLSDVLRAVRLSGSIQFCLIPGRDWEVDAGQSMGQLLSGKRDMVPFHIVTAGTCWLSYGTERIDMSAGDVVAFPFRTAHKIGSGAGARAVAPARDLPPLPWHEVPVLRYGGEDPELRILCGFVECPALNFRPLRESLPAALLVRTRKDPGARWLRATVDQIIEEIDRPSVGAIGMLQRLTEVMLVELMRQQIAGISAPQSGWFAAVSDPSLARCLALLHGDPDRAWTIPALAAASGLSRSTLAARFQSVLGTSPMRYLRDWRLYLASQALLEGGRPVSQVAFDAGYGSEAAFSRAFSKAFGRPPAEWRHQRHGPGDGV